MDSHWTIDSKGLRRFGMKALRIAGSALMLATMAGPLQAATPAKAKDLEWSNFRPPLTSEADTTDNDGFAHLPDFGTVRHAITVAPNGDIFVAGTGADVDANGDGDCADAADANLQAGAGCALAAASNPAVFRSTDQGNKWRAAAVLGSGGATAGTVAAGGTIEKIVVSPDYPTDNFVGVALSGALGTGANGFAWSTDGGLTFTTAAITGTVTETGTQNIFENIVVRTAALSPDFNFNDGSGSIAIGGSWGGVAGTSNAYTTTANTFKAAAVGNRTATGGTGVWLPITMDGTDRDQATDAVVDLAYTYNEEPVALAALYVDDAAGGGTCGAVVTAGALPNCGAGAETMVPWAAGNSATRGRVMFKDTYQSGGSFMAGWTDAAGTATVGGVFRFNGTAWERKTPTTGNCSGGVADMSVSGTGSATRIVTSLLGSNQVCRSTNEGSSWSKAEADGGDTMCDQCRVNTAGAVTTVANNRTTPNNVFWTSSAAVSATNAAGGLSKSTDMGSSWLDTGLTNLPFVVTSVQEVDANKAFANGTPAQPGGGTVGGGASAAARAVFWTENYGTGAGWRQSVRYAGTDLSIGPVGASFLTDNTWYIRRSAATTDNLLKTSDGGRTWKKTTSDPFGSGPDTNELLVADSFQNGSVAYIGGNKGHVALTTDGGATWTILAKDFGEGIDEFDIIDTARTMFIVTAQDSDNTRKLWWTGDSGATFTQIGDASTAWGTGDPATNAFSTYTNSIDRTTGKGTVVVVAGGTVSTADVFRYDLTAQTGAWVDGGTDTEWDSSFNYNTPGVGDGWTLTLFDNDVAQGLKRTVNPLSTNSSDWATRQMMDTSLVQNGTANEIGGVGGASIMFSGASLLSSCKDAGGPICMQVTNGGRIQDITLTTDFSAGPTVTSPINNTNVPTNVGLEGVPTVFRWNGIGKANCYEVQISLENNFNSPALDGTQVPFAAGSCGAGAGVSTGSSLQITNAAFALVVGQQYWWRVRVRATDASVTGATATAAQGNPGHMVSPWSAVSSFTVSTTSPTVNVPQPSLPLNNSTLPGLNTILSWNNPPGVTQVQVQVTPLNGDGPAINLILGAAVTQYEVPAPLFGTGPYVMLPGATYTWRVRTTNATTSVGENDPSWGPWSEPRSFTTARPNAGTIQLVDPINGKVTTDTTPTLTWKDANPAMFYYEVQLSADPNFGEQGAKASVFYNLIHGGQSTPPDSWTVPDANALPKGTYFWRIRQRLQATPLGTAETGIAWTAPQSFVVQ